MQEGIRGPSQKKKKGSYVVSVSYFNLLTADME